MIIGLTGYSGVLGRRLCDDLNARGHDVVTFEGDIRDDQQVRSWFRPFDCLIHAAALVPVRDAVLHPQDAYGINVVGSANVAKAASKHSRCGMIYISTSHVYSASDVPLNEQSATGNTTLYGLTKLAGEAEVVRFAPKVLILRLFSFFDARQQAPYLVPALYDQISSAPPNATVSLRGWDSVRDFAAAKWMAALIRKLAEAGAEGIINCGTGTGTTIAALAAMLASAMHRADVTWSPADNDVRDSRVAEISRLRALLGDLPDFGLERALAEFVEDRKRSQS